MSAYEFKVPPKQHQLALLQKTWDTPAWANFGQMGTGKTKVTLDNICALYLAGKVDCAIVFTKKSIRPEWVAEAEKNIPDGIDYDIYVWDVRNRAATYEKMFDDPEGKLTIFVVNTESVLVERCFMLCDKFVHGAPCFFVLDESIMAKNPKAKRTKQLFKLAHACPYRRILNGEPMPNGPMDLYAQLKLLDKTPFGFSSYFAFRARYAILQDMQVGPRRFKRIAGYQNMEELQTKLRTISTRVLRKDCVDLPAKSYHTREIELTQEQRRVYDSMVNTAVQLFQDGAMATADNVLTMLAKLHQIVCGFVTTDEGTPVPLENDREREVVDLVSNTAEHSLVWAHYQYSVENLLKLISAEMGPECVAAYYGKTKSQDREDYARRFQDPGDPLRVLIMSEAGAYGLNLMAATNVVYFSNSFKLDVRSQSEDRCHRIGQKRGVLYTDLITRGTVDETVLASLRAKRKLSDYVLEDVHSTLLAKTSAARPYHGQPRGGDVGWTAAAYGPKGQYR